MSTSFFSWLNGVFGVSDAPPCAARRNFLATSTATLALATPAGRALAAGTEWLTTVGHTAPISPKPDLEALARRTTFIAGNIIKNNQFQHVGTAFICRTQEKDGPALPLIITNAHVAQTHHVTNLIKLELPNDTSAICHTMTFQNPELGITIQGVLVAQARSSCHAGIQPTDNLTSDFAIFLPLTIAPNTPEAHALLETAPLLALTPDKPQNIQASHALTVGYPGAFQQGQVATYAPRSTAPDGTHFLHHAGSRTSHHGFQAQKGFSGGHSGGPVYDISQDQLKLIGVASIVEKKGSLLYAPSTDHLLPFLLAAHRKLLNPKTPLAERFVTAQPTTAKDACPTAGAPQELTGLPAEVLDRLRNLYGEANPSLQAAVDALQPPSPFSRVVDALKGTFER
ncbi:MAG: hypothetical protein WAX89_03085 [Alphaproteobacteria bacterium]